MNMEPVFKFLLKTCDIQQDAVSFTQSPSCAEFMKIASLSENNDG